MGSTETIKIIVITHYIPSDEEVVGIYIVGTSVSGDFMNSNTYCYSGSFSGFVDCDGSGRYLIFLLENSQSMGAAEIRAYNYDNLSPTAIVTNLENLTEQTANEL